MAKAAATEPSMDDILSSIRQIISDDDDIGEVSDEASEAETLVEAEKSDPSHIEEVADLEVAKAEVEQDEIEQVEIMQDEALELTSEQIVEDVEIDEVSSTDIDMPEMVVPDDISFDETEMHPEPIEPESVEEIASQKSLPDPDLSSDIAEKLLEPATDAAVSSAFAQLGTMGFSDKDLTIENMIREMLRPMLKTWLDENLPSVVETMVRKEIERLSRGA